MPTSLDQILLFVYPATLLLGSLFSLIDPAARNAPYNPITQSHPPTQAPSYFALKRNFLNTYFVKVNWAWVSVAYILFLFTHSANGPTSGLVFTPKRLRGLVRYGIVTLSWTIVTQWFFGPPLIDRGFRVTGGACELASRFEGQGGKTELVTSKACKVAGGTWQGGHDISGHVFILVLGSAFLFMELIPILLKGGMKDDRLVRRKDGGVARAAVENLETEEEDGGMLSRIGSWTPTIVASLSWYMLLMTAIYFHTWFEKVRDPPRAILLMADTNFIKLTGLLVAFSALFVTFFLPRAVPSMRDIVGLPGI